MTNKPIVLEIHSNVAEVQKSRTELLRKNPNARYSDDFIETEEAIYYIRMMGVTFDMDKILLPPPEGRVDRYDIQGFLDGLEAKIKEIKKVANYNPGNIQNTPPPQFQTRPAANMPPVSQPNQSGPTA